VQKVTISNPLILLGTLPKLVRQALNYSESKFSIPRGRSAPEAVIFYWLEICKCPVKPQVAAAPNTPGFMALQDGEYRSDRKATRNGDFSLGAIASDRHFAFFPIGISLFEEPLYGND